MKIKIFILLLCITGASALFDSPDTEFMDAFNINTSNSGYHGGFVGDVTFFTAVDCAEIDLSDFDIIEGDYINVSIGLKTTVELFELISTTFVYIANCTNTYHFTKHLNLSEQKVWINGTHFEWIVPMNVTQFVWLKTDDSRLWKKFEELHSPYTNVTLIIDSTLNETNQTNQTMNQTGNQTETFSLKLPPHWEQKLVGYAMAFLFFVIGFYLLLRYKSLFITGMVWLFAGIFFLVGYLS